MSPNSAEQLDLSDLGNMTAAIRYVTDVGGQPSFADLEQIPNFKGALMLHLDDHNVCLWPRMSSVACRAIKNLVIDGEITIKPCRVEVYSYSEVGCPELPVAYSWGPHEELTWVPTLLLPRAIRKWGSFDA